MKEVLTMKVGISTYSMEGVRKTRNLNVFEMIDLAVETGFSAIEFTDVYAPEGKCKVEQAKEIAAHA